MQRGKLAITSYGRIICWSEEVLQIKKKRSCLEGCLINVCCFCLGSLCDPTVFYNVETETRIFDASKLRQLTEYYKSEGCCCGKKISKAPRFYC